MTSLSGTKIILPRSVVIYDRESIINQHIKFWLKWNIFVRRCQVVPDRFFVCVCHVRQFLVCFLLYGFRLEHK